MEELLKQILRGQDELKVVLKNEITTVKTELKSELSIVKAELKSEILEVKEAVLRIELSQPQDIVALLERMNKNLESKTEALNKRVFNVETELERLK
ncbi:hypothetical protein V7147_13620 [Bacillus sp. JJ1521]|uniref:hypothetical protein n=1 Tax=Bacillus sp. JJ1521 TaxID=3122957 RepID=UPI002FFF4060